MKKTIGDYIWLGFLGCVFVVGFILVFIIPALCKSHIITPFY